MKKNTLKIFLMMMMMMVMSLKTYYLVLMMSLKTYYLVKKRTKRMTQIKTNHHQVSMLLLQKLKNQLKRDMIINLETLCTVEQRTLACGKSLNCVTITIPLSVTSLILSVR
jgi:hypothetical protein